MIKQLHKDTRHYHMGFGNLVTNWLFSLLQINSSIVSTFICTLVLSLTSCCPFGPQPAYWSFALLTSGGYKFWGSLQKRKTKVQLQECHCVSCCTCSFGNPLCSIRHLSASHLTFSAQIQHTSYHMIRTTPVPSTGKIKLLPDKLCFLLIWC